MPRSYHDYDNESDELDRLFSPSERPTINERLRRGERLAKEDPSFVLGRLMVHVMDLRREVNRLNAEKTTRPSLRPHVQTAGVSASVATAIAVIYQILVQTGALK